MDPEKSSTLEYARPLRRRRDLHPILGILGIPLAFISGLLLMSGCALILDLLTRPGNGPGFPATTIVLVLGLLIGWAALFLIRGAFGGKLHHEYRRQKQEEAPPAAGFDTGGVCHGLMPQAMSLAAEKDAPAEVVDVREGGSEKPSGEYRDPMKRAVFARLLATIVMSVIVAAVLGRTRHLDSLTPQEYYDRAKQFHNEPFLVHAIVYCILGIFFVACVEMITFVIRWIWRSKS